MTLFNISKIADYVSTRIVAKVEANWADYAENGIDEDALVNDMIQDDINPDLPFYEDLVEALLASPEVQTAFSHLRVFIKEQIRDFEIEQRQTTYHGRRDFI